MRLPARLASCAALIVCSTLSALAHATGDDEKTQCIAASDQGQQLRDDGKYRLAHEAFARCARPTCPAIVSRDCGVWLFDIDERSPTVIFAAVDDKGSDLSDVQVTIDGTPFASRLTGLPAAVDPGDHLFRYEAPGLAPFEEHVAIKAGEKNRVLHVRLAPVAAAPPPTTPPAGNAAGRAGVPLPAWLFGAVAVGAFASEASFGIAGLSQRSQDLSGPDKCAPNCSSSEKSSIQTKFVIADVSLGVGVVSLGLATYFFVRSRQPQPERTESAFDFAPLPGGGVARWGGRF